MKRNFYTDSETGIIEYDGEYGDNIERLNECWNYFVAENNKGNLDEYDLMMLTSLNHYLGDKGRHSC